jgi:putative ABC transport system ATP-binding protein
MAIASPPLIEIRNVHLTLRSLAGPVEILRGIDFAAGAGEAIGIVGPSGSGKTTLLMVIGGLERTTSGQAIIDGQDLGRLSEDELTRFRRDRLGIVFQSFHLITTMTALENVAIPLELKGAPQAFARAEEKLRAVGLGHRLLHYPGELSGGEQQRVAIARALAAGVRIILADEPTGNLDQVTGRQILDLLFDFNAREGLTLLLVTHDPDTARRCHRIVELRDGSIMKAA